MWGLELSRPDSLVMRLFEAVCSSALDRPNENTCGYVRGVDGVNTAAVTLGASIAERDGRDVN